jgi:SHS2 domain-containing protein
VRRGYEFFEHTADVGATVRGATLARLFENAAAAMFDLICDRRTVRPRRRLAVAVQGSSLEDLLVRFLSELLFRHETEGWLLSSMRVERVDRRRLLARGVARGEPIDRARHALRGEIKAITYHQLRIVRGRSAWRVRIVFDI